MSIEGFFNGVADGIRNVFGIDDEPKRSVAPAPRPERSRDLARDSRTSFDRTSGADRATRSSAPDAPRAARPSAPGTPAGSAPTDGGFSLIQQLQAARAQRTTTPDPGQPVTGSGPGMDHGHSHAGQPELTAAEAAQVRSPAAQGPSTGAASSHARAIVLDAASRTAYGTADTLDRSSAAGVAAHNVQQGLDYFARTFGRDGLDGAGAGVDVLIDDRSTDEHGRERFKGNGGYFAMPDGQGGLREAIHFGTGNAYYGARGLVEQQEMLHADDLAIHELVHGIIRKETGHLGGDADEAGATNEGVADVMAAAATRDWRIGEGMYARSERSAYRAMRNIAQPDDPTAIHGLHTTMGQVERERAEKGHAEEHWASGVISTAAYRVQQRIGGEDGWKAVERVFYDSIDNARLGDMTFTAVAGALRTSADTVYGSGSAVSRTFDEELRRAGL